MEALSATREESDLVDTKKVFSGFSRRLFSKWDEHYN